MYYFRKVSEAHAPGRDIFNSVLYFSVVNMILCFSVVLGVARLFSLDIRTRWLLLFCIIINLIFSILWYLPIRLVYSIIIFVLIGTSTFLLLGNEITEALSDLVGGRTSFHEFTRLLTMFMSERTDITAFIFSAILSFVGSGVLVRKNSASVYHVAAFITAFLCILAGMNKVLFWEALYMSGALIKRIGYCDSTDRGARLVSSFVKPLGFFAILTVLFYTELPYMAELMKKTRLSTWINGLLSPIINNVLVVGKNIFGTKVSPMPDLCFEYGAVSFVDVLNDYSIPNISLFLKTNSLRLLLFAAVSLSYILFFVIKVRRQNAQLRVGSRRIRQTNRRRALQEIGEASGRLATWYTGTKITPWDDEFVVRTASALPRISGVDLERMTATMNRMRYGKDEILEEDYRKALDIYLQMFYAGRITPSEAVRRKLNLPV